MQPFVDSNLGGKLQLQLVNYVSILLSVQTKSLIEDLGTCQERKDMFVFSNVVKRDPINNSKNKKVIGMFGNKISESLTSYEFVALRAKVFT